MTRMTPEAFCQPSPVALYRHFDLNGELLYIGVTADPARRWQQHREQSAWAPFVADGTVHWLGDRDRALVAERQAIARERPLFNQARPLGSRSVLSHRLDYLRNGVSGLPRRVRCRDFPQDFCVSCGPDVDAWLDTVAKAS